MAKRSQEISSTSLYSKLKDGLYKIGDIIIIAIILAGMYFALTNKLNEIMPISFSQLTGKVAVDENLPGESSNTTNEVVNIDIDDTSSTKTESTDTENQENSAETDTTQSEDQTTTEDDNQSTDETNAESTTTSENTEQESQESNETDTSSEVLITITIPPGSTAIQVAEILYDNKIIAEKGLFLTKINELGIANKLLAGSFKLKQGMTYEDIAKILTGQM